MPWNATWGDPEETYIIIRPEDPWEWSELDATVENYHKWISEKPYPCTAIYHIGDRVKMPRPSMMRRTQVYMASRPANLKLVVIAEAAPAITRILMTAAKLFSMDGEMAATDTLDEAIERAKEIHKSTAINK